MLISDLNANVKATGLATGGKNLGDLTLSANTTAGRVNFALDSNLAGASMQGAAQSQLASGYPTSAQITFKNVTWTGLAPLFVSSPIAQANFEAAADGDASVNGPLTGAQQLRASFQLTRLQLSSNSPTLRKAGAVLLQNQGPISATLDRGVIRIQAAHLTGPRTSLEASGVVPLGGQPVDLALKGNMDLAILEKLGQSVTSSGSIVLDATVRGTLAQPRLGGQVELHNSSFDYAGLPTGIWKANGVVLLNGDSAVIRNLSAGSGWRQDRVYRLRHHARHATIRSSGPRDACPSPGSTGPQRHGIRQHGGHWNHRQQLHLRRRHARPNLLRRP